MPKTPRHRRRATRKKSQSGLVIAGAVAGVALIGAALVIGLGGEDARPKRKAAKAVVSEAEPAVSPPSSPASTDAVVSEKGPVAAAVAPAPAVEAEPEPEPTPAPKPEKLPDVDRPLAGVTCSWVGNTFPHGRGGSPDRKWVPQNATDICVTSDGTVFTNVFWEEGGANNTEIKGGDVVNQGHGSHGWGHQGGDAVAANAKYMYAGHVFDNEGGGLKGITNWPPKGKTWFGVSRRNRSNIKTGDPFEGGKGGKESPKASFLVVHEVAEKATIKGLYATDDELFVSCPHDDKVRVYDANTMKPRREFEVRDPQQLAMDRAGNLWIAVGDGSRVMRFTSKGKRLSQAVSLPSGSTVGDICIDARDRLLVADTGPRAQVLIIEGLNTRPRMSGTMGVKGGVYAGAAARRGAIGAMRFHAMTGIGADAAGNVYVASSCRPFSGLRLESYSPRGELNWRLMGLEFVSRACEDPDDQNTLYSQGLRYQMDYDKPRGEEWSYRAHTYDGERFPDDPGLLSPLVRRIGGKKLIFSTGQNSAMPVGIYRFDPKRHGEIAIPCGLFVDKPDKKRPNTPQNGGWIWIDADGDGKHDESEFSTRGKNEPWAGGYWVDTKGDLWFGGGNVRRYAFQGFTSHGAPKYDFDHLETFPPPAPFKEVKRIRYDAEHDIMYLGGTTPERKNVHWKGMGPVLCRYDGWSKGNREPAWTVVGTYDSSYGGGHESCEPLSFDVAGDYVFVALAGSSRKLGVKWAHVDVYETATGRKVGWMEPSKDIGQVGLMDMVECLRAFRRPDGEYIILEEEDYAAKNLMYRWRPQ